MTTRDDFERYLDLGFTPIALRPRSKRPKGDDWQSLNRETSIDRFVDGDNIGVLTGEPSGWLVDIDLDDPIARDNAAHFLPETLIFGRATNKASHWLYVSHECPSKKFQDKSIGMVVELRSNGMQTVFPPSIHESTLERISWANENEITRIDAKDLHRRCAMLASFAILESAHSTMIGLPPEIASRLTGDMEASQSVRSQVLRWLDIRPNEPLKTAESHVTRALAYTSKMAAAVAGQGGHQATFMVAVAARRGFSLSESDTMIVLHEFNTRCSPQWSERELKHKCDDAGKSSLPDGFLLVASPPSPEKWTKDAARSQPRTDDKYAISELIRTWDVGMDAWGTPSARVNGHVIRATSLSKSIVLGVHERIGKFPGEHDVRAAIAFVQALAEVSPPLVESAKKPSIGSQIWMTPEEYKSSSTPPDWLVERLIPKGSVTLLSGPPGGGKTWVAYALAVCLASHLSGPDEPLPPKWIERWTAQCPVFLLDAESGPFELVSRINAVARGLQIEIDPIIDARMLNICTMPQIRMNHARWEESLTEIATCTDRPGFVIVDSLTSMSPGIDENSSEIADGLNVLGAVCKRTGLSAMVLSHTRKTAGDKTTDDVKGNTAIMGAVDQAFIVTCDNERNRTISTIRERSGDALPRHTIRIVGDRFGHDGGPGSITVELGERIVSEPKKAKKTNAYEPA